MSQKNETGVLVLALLITAALLGGGFWWFTQKSRVDLDRLTTSKPNDTNSASSPTTGEAIANNFTAVQNVPTGLFNYGGSTSWAPIRLTVDPAIQAARPEFRLRYVEPTIGGSSSSTGIQSLIDGKLAIAQSSRPVSDSELARAQQRGFRLEQVPVAIDGLAVAVNSNLNISGLTLQQLQSIYTGQVTNWSQLGGPNVPIKPFSRPVNTGGTVELFVQEILNNQSFGSNVEFVSTTTGALQKLASSPGGIYYASAPEVVPQCSIKPIPLGRTLGQFVPPYQEPLIPPSACPNQRNQLNIDVFQSGKYPITRNLYVVIKQNGQVEEQAGRAYANFLLTQQGQDMITETGFVKIR